MLASSAVDRGFKSGQVKPKTIKLIFVASPQSTQHKGEEQRLVGPRIMCPSGVTCQPVDCFESVLALKSPTKPFVLVQNGHHLIDM